MRDAGLVDARAEDTGSDGGFEPKDAEASDADARDAGNEDLGPRFLTSVTSSVALAGLGGPTGDVKYLLPVPGAVPRAPITEPCYFQNMRLYDYHLGFLQSFPELSSLNSTEYRNLVLRRSTRIWWGGGIKDDPSTTHPTGGRGILLWTVYHEVSGADRLNTDDLVEVQGILSGCVYSPERLAFLPIDPYQTMFVRQQRTTLAEQGVATILPEELGH